MKKNILLSSILSTLMLSVNVSASENDEVGLYEVKKATKKLIIKTREHEDEITSLKRAIEVLNKKLEAFENGKKSDITLYKADINTEEIIDKKVVVDAWLLNARKTPIASLLTNEVTNYKAGATLKVVKKVNDHWYQLDNGLYVNGAYIKEINPIEIKVVKKVNLRSYPDYTQETILSVLGAGSIRIAVAKILNDEWYILDDGTFIHSNFAEKI